MLIDWFTVSAQIINFLVLILLLKRFLYKPLTAAITRREQKIAEQFRLAEESGREADNRARALAEKKQTLEREKEKIMENARQKVSKWREEALEKARQEVKDKKEEWLARLDSEKKKFSQAVKTKIADLVFTITRKVLYDLANSNLEQQLLDAFLQKTDKEIQIAKPTCKETERCMIAIYTGMELEHASADNLRNRVLALFPNAAGVRFAIKPELGFGLELLIGDRKVEWNLARYMNDMEKNIFRDLHLSPGNKQ